MSASANWNQESHGPPVLAFIPSLALLPSALVSAYRPVTCQKAELWQYRIREPLILANPVPFTVMSSDCNDCPNLEFLPTTVLPLAGKFLEACTPFPVSEPMETY